MADESARASVVHCGHKEAAPSLNAGAEVDLVWRGYGRVGEDSLRRGEGEG